MQVASKLNHYVKGNLLNLEVYTPQKLLVTRNYVDPACAIILRIVEGVNASMHIGCISH